MGWRRVARLLLLGAAGMSGCVAGVSPSGPGDGGTHSDGGGPAVPGAPRDVVATATIGGATVSWSAPQSNGGLPVTGYVVSITPDTPSAQISVNGLDATVTGLLPGHTVAILVAAVNSVGTGPPASSSPVTPPDVPAAPTSVVAQPGDGSATVSWSTPPGDGGRPITGYQVEISPPAPGAAVQVSATLAVITGLTNGTAYTFRVAATNAVGTGPQSNPSAPVTPTAAPSPPTGLAYSANPAAYTVGMAIAPNVPSSGGGAPTGYVASPSLPPGLTLAPATGIITGTPLAAVSGTYHVTARNVAGSSSVNLAITVSAVVVVVPPSAPIGVGALPAVGGASVGWSPPASNGGAPVTSYVVTVSPATPSAVVTVNGLGATVTGLGNGRTYTFAVAAVNSTGTGPAASSAPITTPDVPGAPTGVTAQAGVRSATVSWSAPSSNGGSPVTGYQVQLSPATAGTSISVNGTTASVSGLSNGTAYIFRVSAVNAVGTGAASAPSSAVTTPDVPGAPTGVAAQAGVRSATVSWSAPSSNGGSPVTGYQVQVSPATAGASISVNGTTASVGGLSNGTAYIFRISAVNAVGTGAASAPSSAVTTPDVPGAPTGVTAQAGDRSATLSWSAPSSNGGSPITGYQISISPTASGATISVNGTTASIGGLTNGTTYTFRVSALNAVGTGAASAPSAAVTPAPPLQPPSGLVYATNPATYTVGVAISPNTPTVGGGAVSSWSVNPTLPAGLALAGTTGVVSGTPTATRTGTYRVTAANSAGSTFVDLAITVQAAGDGVFPIAIAPSHNSLVDASGRPFLLQGDAAWSGIAELNQADALQYLDDRQQRGFNAILVNLVEHRFTSHTPPQANAAGDKPFTNNSDLSTTNDAYFDHVDWFLDQARQRGILVLLAPAYMGYKGSTDGWISEMQSTGTTKLQTYGRYLGTRYRSVPNILWVEGGDYTPTSSDLPLVQAIVDGLKSAGDTHLHTAHWGGEPSFTGPQPSWIDVDTVYVDSPPHNYPFMVQGWNLDAGTRPVFFIEGWYENEHESTRLQLRSDMYQPLVTGEAGFVFGIFPIWSFWTGAPGNDYDNDGNYANWQSALGSPGGGDAARARTLFDSLDWSHLVPDVNNVFLTGGYGSWDSASYVLAARTSDGHLGVAYFTDLRTVTFDLSKMAGSTRATWFDPSSGATTTASGSPFPNSGSRSLTPPGLTSDGSTDWVLLLQSP